MLNRTLKKGVALLSALAVLLPAVPALAADETADSVYLNGNIYTVDQAFSTATAMAVKGDRLVYVGSDAEARSYIGAGTQVVDLGGKTVLPGLMDAHMDVQGVGEAKMNIDCFYKPKETILELVRAAAQEAEPGQWITGEGWINTIWEESDYPTKEELDAVAPDNPVLLTRADSHMAWANSKAFEVTGVTKDTPNPEGGEFLKTETGDLQGCMTDTAMRFIRQQIPAMSVEQKREALLLAQADLFSHGITSAMEDVGTVELYDDVVRPLYASGELKLRINGTLVLRGADDETLGYLTAHPIDGESYVPEYDNHLILRTAKIFTDGSLGARSAAMLEEYSDYPGHIGNLQHTDEAMYEMVKGAYDAGYQVATHSIGDAAIDQALRIYEKVMEENPREDPRMRIEHFQIASQDLVERAMELGVIASMQPTHATSDMNMAEDRVGHERIQYAYAWREILDRGGIIPGGSDAPTEYTNPYFGLYAAVTRKDRLGNPSEGWYAQQCMTREEALRSFTIWAAYAEYSEEWKGSLEAGKVADFVVIDRDYMTCPEEDIKDIQALMTVSGGQVVYTKDLSQPTVVWNGLPMTFNSDVVVEPGKIYVPLNDTVNGIGAQTSVVDGQAEVTLEGRTATVPATEVNGVYYVPVRALFEGLGRNVTWYGDGQCVSIGWLVA